MLAMLLQIIGIIIICYVAHGVMESKKERRNANQALKDMNASIIKGGDKS